MITIESGAQNGYQSDRALIKLTHTFNNDHLIQLVQAAVKQIGLEHVLAAIGVKEAVDVGMSYLNRTATEKAKQQIEERMDSADIYFAANDTGLIEVGVAISCLTNKPTALNIAEGLAK